VFIALAEHFLKFPSEKARTKFLELYSRSPEQGLPLFHGYLLREKSPEALKAVAEQLMIGGWDHSITVETLHGMLDLKAIGAREPLLIKLVRFAQERFKDPDESRMLLELSIPAASAEIEKYLENYSQKDLEENGVAHLKIVKESVQLVLHPAADRKKTIDQWVDLIRREAEVWGLPRLLLDELLRATPWRCTNPQKSTMERSVVRSMASRRRRKCLSRSKWGRFRRPHAQCNAPRETEILKHLKK
jgi:hypothetical protein